MSTWLELSCSVDLDEHGHALLVLLHGIDADVVEQAGAEVAQGHRGGSVRQGQLCAASLDGRSVDDSVTWEGGRETSGVDCIKSLQRAKNRRHILVFLTY